MDVIFYGVRGSIPAPGPNTVRYGGNTVCVQVTLADGTIVIIDAGSGLRECGRVLAQQKLQMPVNILHTHSHWDHLIGIPFFSLLYRPDGWVRTWPMFTAAQREVQRRRGMFDNTFFPVHASELPARFENMEDSGEIWRIGSAEVRRIALNHPGGAQGFRIDDADGRSLVLLTDNELTATAPVISMDELARFSAGADLFIHDSQYLASEMPLKRGWGHSTIDDVLELARRAEARHAVLFHHDPDRTDDALDGVARDAKQWGHDHAPETRITVAHEGLVLKL